LNGDDGLLSLDFLAGFTIFMVALVVVVSMVPGLLVGLQSSGIDYDAVAYRTGVILVEDPGWPVHPPWELYDVYHKDEIERMGLAVSRDTPNILLSTKIEKFFNGSADGSGFFDYPDDYRRRVLFGDYPYVCNISMSILGGPTYMVGDARPQGYGYIRRVVKVKEPSSAIIQDNDLYRAAVPSNRTQFTVRLNCSELLDPSISPAYRIDPRIERISVKIANFSYYLNSSPYATLKNVRFHKNYATGSLPFPYTSISPEKYRFQIDGVDTTLTPNAHVNSTLYLMLQPASLPIDPNSVIDIVFTFEEPAPDPPRTTISGLHLYDYNATNVTRPDLTFGVLEVAVW